MAPIFEQAATQLEPDLRLVKVDSDAVQELLRGSPSKAYRHRCSCITAGDCAQVGVMPLPKLLAWTREHVDGMKV
jgi:thioredoxin 2